MFDSVLGVIGSIPPPPNTASWVDAKELDFGLIWPQHFTQFSSESLENFREQVLFWAVGPCGCLQDFRPSRHSVLPIVFLMTMVPAALRLLTRSSFIVLGWFLTVSHDHSSSTMWDLAWSLIQREIGSYFVFLPFANNHTNCCHLLTKLLDNGLVDHSSLALVYNPWTALWSWPWWRVWNLIDWLLLWTGIFYTCNSPFKRVLLIWAPYLYKRHPVARNLADW